MPAWWQWVIAPARTWNLVQQEKREAEDRTMQERLKRIEEREAARAEQRRQEELADLEELTRQFLSRPWMNGNENYKYAYFADEHGWPFLVFAEWEPGNAYRPMTMDTSLYFPHRGPQHSMILHTELQEETARIIDLVGDPHNRGFGTVLLKFTEPILAAHGAKVITGWLSAADLDHRPRQIRFYEKNGYTVKINGDEGSIRKSLTSADDVANRQRPAEVHSNSDAKGG